MSDRLKVLWARWDGTGCQEQSEDSAPGTAGTGLVGGGMLGLEPREVGRKGRKEAGRIEGGQAIQVEVHKQVRS